MPPTPEQQPSIPPTTQPQVAIVAPVDPVTQLPARASTTNELPGPVTPAIPCNPPVTRSHTRQQAAAAVGNIPSNQPPPPTRKPKVPPKTKASTKTKRVVESTLKKKPTVVEKLPKIIIPGGKFQKGPRLPDVSDTADVEMQNTGKFSRACISYLQTILSFSSKPGAITCAKPSK